jgi:heterodisulfide reductase subunit A2
MKTGVFFCKCGTNVSDKIDAERVRARAMQADGDTHFGIIDFMCSEEGKAAFERTLVENKIDRVVVAACSPRDHEGTFMQVMSRAGVNPYLLQMVNIREQVAWVTEDRDKASDKAARYVTAAMRRVALHDPLERKEIDVSPDVLVIGAGPAGLKNALTIAEAGRKVTLVEKSPVIGGMPVRFEELFPKMECGPCMLEPIMGEVLHGPHAENIELLTLSEVVGVVGSYGNFTVKIRVRPRYVDAHKCVGCGECVTPCPESTKNEYNCNMNERKAVDFPFAGALPNSVFVDSTVCRRWKGDDCHLCKDACPVEDAFQFDEKEQIIERNVGAILIAVGTRLYDCSHLPNLGYGCIPDVVTSEEYERIAASNGPTGGQLLTSKGTLPESVALVHCVGSLDKNHCSYCSGVCCQEAFKLNQLIEHKAHGAKVFHLYKELSVPGKEEFELYRKAQANPGARFIRYNEITELAVSREDGKNRVRFKNDAGQEDAVLADVVVLCPAIVPGQDATGLSGLLGAGLDQFGFFEELHGRTDSAQSKMKGIYLAGTCQAPMEIQRAMGQGMAAAGYMLSGLVPGRKLEISPITAAVIDERCSGCKTCVSVCPYKAVGFDDAREISLINDLLCHGCGTCVAACPSGAIVGNHFTNEQIMAEIEEILR